MIKHVLIAFFTTIILFLLFYQQLFFYMGSYLVYESPEFKDIDKIVVLSGAKGERVRKAVEMYHELKVPLIMSGNSFYLQSVPYYMKELAISLGVPETDVVLEEKSLSTADHINNLLPYFIENKDENVLIVTSKFHTRRSFYVFSKLSKNSSFNVYIVGADDGIDYHAWWKDYEMLETITLEWARLIFYRLFW
jgi:uncharacterized SAM-binding protein YcdF (DUF218 family)